MQYYYPFWMQKYFKSLLSSSSAFEKNNQRVLKLRNKLMTEDCLVNIRTVKTQQKHACSSPEDSSLLKNFQLYHPNASSSRRAHRQHYDLQAILAEHNNDIEAINARYAKYQEEESPQEEAKQEKEESLQQLQENFMGYLVQQNSPSTSSSLLDTYSKGETSLIRNMSKMQKNYDYIENLMTLPSDSPDKHFLKKMEHELQYFLSGTDQERLQRQKSKVDPKQLYFLFFDGASKGNKADSPASIGFVIFNSQDKCVARQNRRILPGKNNYAEYMSMVCGMKYCLELGIERVRVIGDSQLVIRQLQGQYEIKNRELFKYYYQAHVYRKAFQDVLFVHVMRTMNTLADAEANKPFKLS